LNESRSYHRRGARLRFSVAASVRLFGNLLAMRLAPIVLFFLPTTRTAASPVR